MPEVRHIPKAERAPNNNGEAAEKCAKVALIAEVDKLTREVHTVTHQLSTITKRLFELKEQISKVA